LVNSKSLLNVEILKWLEEMEIRRLEALEEIWLIANTNNFKYYHCFDTE
jgi:hypothetical protein